MWQGSKKWLFFYAVCSWLVCDTTTNKIWDNNDDWYYNKIIEWDDGYKKRKARKAQIKKLIKREKN